MASSSSVEGMAPASLSFVAFTITITRIALSPLLVEAAPAPLSGRRTSGTGIDIPPKLFFAPGGRHPPSR
jgi:hypothetical protein